MLKSLLPIFPITLACLIHQPVGAVVLYSGDNTANQTAPDPQRQAAFDSVARLCNSSGGGSYGSAVHIQGKYLLTANHVSTAGGYLTFDGSTILQLDGNFSSITIGTADMKLIKLLIDPQLEGTPLFSKMNETQLADATLIGWGVGRNTATDDSNADETVTTWAWGGSSTFAKRWGTNAIDAALLITDIENYNYSYLGLRTFLDSNAGDNEAAAGVYDSGSGLFVNDSGTWKLAGLTTLVGSHVSNASTFADKIESPPVESEAGPLDPRDANYFVHIRSLASDIEAAIPDETTLSGWKTDHSLYGDDAADTADTDNDGIPQLIEFALGGDPNLNDLSISPRLQTVQVAGETYLELQITRPTGLSGIAYTAQTTTDLNSWPNDSAGVLNANPSPVDNGDGTETVTYRRTAPISNASAAFIRVQISIVP